MGPLHQEWGLALYQTLRIVLIGAACSALANCAFLPAGSDQAKVVELIDSLKCELNQFYAKYDQTLRDNRKYRGFALSKTVKGAGSLDLKLQVTSTESGSVTAGTTQFPIIPSLLATAGLGGSLNDSVTTDVKLLIEQDTDKEDQVKKCDPRNGAYVDMNTGRSVYVMINGSRLHDWLYNFVASEKGLIGGRPRVQLQTLTLTSGITFTETGNVGIVTLIPILPGPSLGASRAYAQTVTLVINGTAKAPAPAPS